jgi:tRNA pseudouridine55 synthase
MDIAGFILIDKEQGPTSHDIVDKLRKITKINKIGHAGTLDPMASGLLILAVGRQATKNISKYVKLDKEYEAEIFLGAETDTYDRLGKIVNISNRQIADIETIIDILNEFEGELLQVPPMYSAKKHKGKKLYELARKGEMIERQPAKISIYEIKLISYDFPILKIKIQCSSGTYIRSLAHDIGIRIGVGAYLNNLRRTSIGSFEVEGAQKIDRLNSDNWQKFLFGLE